MGNENDKRLTKSRQVNNNDNNNKNNNSGGTQNQQTPAQNINLNQNQNERINPYDKNQMGGTNSNNNIPRLNRPELGGAGQKPLNRSMTTKRKNTVTLKMLKDAFRTYSIDGSYLNRPRFNDAIESIFRFNIPEMHYTHLCNKIYDLLDSSGDGKIQEDEFLDGLGRVLKDRNFRLLLSMMAMMSLPDKTRDYIEVREIKEFFFQSYIEGYKHLGWQIKRNPEEFRKNNLPVATIEQLGKWAHKYEREISNAIDRDLREFDPNVGNSITFEQFLRWISIDHTIYIQYGNKNIMIATSLIRLDDIYYDENAIGGSNGPYPSF
jgi:Ca2+-binding EF-hand superfamily protein